MNFAEVDLMRVFLLVAVLVSSGCFGGDEDAAPVDPAAGQVAPLSLGELATLHLANDSVTTGLAVKIRSGDGTETYALFRGPRRLGEEITSGTWTFHADSLPTRVRVVGEGERLVGGS
jgi:hypothetical protein